MPSPIQAAIRKTVTQGVQKLAGFNRGRMAEPTEPHPFLSGLYAPMDRELTLDQLVVTGTIPPSLDGRYLRIGPNPIGVPHAASHHWFVGDSGEHSDVHPVHEIESNSTTPMALPFLDYLGADDGDARAR